MSSPLLWGPNGAVNLQNQEILGNGQLISSDGVRNFVPAGSFENGTVGNFALGSVTLSGITPTTTISAGAASLTQSIVTSGAQLSGTYSMQVASAGTWTAGQGVYVPFTADASQQARVQQISFAYSITSGTSNVTIANSGADTFAVGVYDVTNSVWLAVSPAQYGAIQGYKGTCNIQVQLSSNSTSYQLFFFAQNASAGAVTIVMDQVFVGPQDFNGYGVTMTDWVAYTPTFTGFGTVSGALIYSRRVGDSLEVKGVFTSGTPTATQAQITIGFAGINTNVSIDSGKLPSLTAVGSASVNIANSNFYSVGVTASGGNNYFTFGAQTSSTSSLVPGNGNAVTGANNFSFFASVPIVGWSSNSQIVSQYDGRAVAAAVTATSYSVAANGTVIASSKSIDTHSAYNTSTGNFTCPVSGIYSVYLAQVLTSAGTAVEIGKNGVGQNTILQCYPGQYNQEYLSGAILVQANAGDTLQIICSVANTFNGVICFSLISGAQNIQAGQVIAASYTSATTSFSSAGPNQVIFPTKSFDTTGSYNTSTGNFTAPTTGYYLVICAVRWSVATYGAGAVQELYLYKNSSNVSILSRGNVQNYGSAILGLDGSQIVALNAGDTISIYAYNNTVTSLDGNSATNYVSIEQIAGAAGGGTTVITGGGGSGITRSVNVISTATSAGATSSTDYVYLVSGTTTLTLPTAVGNTNLYTVKNTGANTVSIATTSSQTIDGSTAPITLPVANTSLDLISDGSNWRII